MILADMPNLIQAKIDGAWPAGMTLTEDQFQLELAAWLDGLANELMATRPDLESASLDEWLARNTEVLTDAERNAARVILDAY